MAAVPAARARRGRVELRSNMGIEPSELGEEGSRSAAIPTVGERPKGLVADGWVCHAGRVVEHDDRIDFALAAYREDGQWTVHDLAHDHLGDIETIAHALRRVPGDGGAVAMVAVDEDFFVIVRVAGATTRVLLSDVTAAEDWELAGSAVEFLGPPRAGARGRGRAGAGRRPRPAR